MMPLPDRAVHPESVEVIFLVDQGDVQGFDAGQRLAVVINGVADAQPHDVFIAYSVVAAADFSGRQPERIDVLRKRIGQLFIDRRICRGRVWVRAASSASLGHDGSVM
jgi:hypothetical protein